MAGNTTVLIKQHRYSVWCKIHIIFYYFLYFYFSYYLVKEGKSLSSQNYHQHTALLLYIISPEV